MKILLININPVVSRLLTLCTRDEHIVLDEVVSADAVDKTSYEIVFVDEASLVDEVQALLETVKARKKVFISYTGEAMKGFDETIKKPFLPSQIINIIESIALNEPDETEERVVTDAEKSMATSSLENEEAEDEILPDIFLLSEEDENEDTMPEPEEDTSFSEVLDGNEIAKIKALLEMDDTLEENEEDAISLSDDEVAARKVKVIKEQLIADGLEIVEEDEIVEELSNDTLNVPEDVDETTSKIKKKKEETGLSEEELFRIEEAIMTALVRMKPKKIKKLLKGKETKIKIKLEDDQ